MELIVKKQAKGAALITALLFVALATIAATYMSKRQYFDIRQTDNIISIDRANQATLAAETLAIDYFLIQDDFNNPANKDTDDFDETEKRKEGASYPYDEDGTLSGKILDLQGRFNVNNILTWDEKTNKAIIDQDQVDIFKRLIDNINETASTSGQNSIQIPTEIVDKLVDWLDKDNEVTGMGAEDDTYAAMPIPHKTPNNTIASTSEIMLLEGVWDDTNKTAAFDLLEPFIAALPQRAPINFNIAPKELIAAMVDGMSLSDGDTIANELKETPVDKPSKVVEEFKKLSLFTGANQKNKNALEALKRLEDDKMFEVFTEYFQVEIQAEVGGVISRLKSQVRRKKDGYIFVYARGRGAI